MGRPQLRLPVPGPDRAGRLRADLPAVAARRGVAGRPEPAPARSPPSPAAARASPAPARPGAQTRAPGPRPRWPEVGCRRRCRRCAPGSRPPPRRRWRWPAPAPRSRRRRPRFPATATASAPGRRRPAASPRDDGATLVASAGSRSADRPPAAGGRRPRSRCAARRRWRGRQPGRRCATATVSARSRDPGCSTARAVVPTTSCSSSARRPVARPSRARVHRARPVVELEGDDAAVGEAEVQRVQCRHRSRGDDGAERRRSTAARRRRRAGRPDRRPRPTPRAIRCPSSGGAAAAAGSARSQTRRPGRGVERPDAAGHRQEHAAVTHGGRPRRFGRGGPADLAGVEVERRHAAVLHRDVCGHRVERRRRDDDHPLGGDPSQVEGAAGQQLEAGGRPAPQAARTGDTGQTTRRATSATPQYLAVTNQRTPL